MDVRTIELKKTILEDNDRDADLLRQQLRDEGTYYLNVMSSPGSGKTTTLIRTIRTLQDMAAGQQKESLRIGVMEADIDSDVDARTIIEETGVPAVQLHTGGMCHLDADMSRQGLAELGAKDLDLVFLENVGNLVCPAEFDTGAVKSVVILSVPEGDDKPLKYPLMFQEVDAVLVNKIDAAPVFDFDEERFRKNLQTCNADAPVFFLSAATGEGAQQWCGWLDEQVRNFLGR
ncbi:MAG: hydrogenase nickel incorporation protein HypB [Firmicutes bacterium]|nr:hydrogenase nickel incorporation protein HypB [Bacillota bacterium]